MRLFSLGKNLISNSININIVLFAVFIFLAIFGCFNNRLSKSEVDNYFSRYSNESEKQNRVQLIKELLSYLKKTESVHDDHIIKYAMNILTNSYLTNEDESILIAVDNTSIQAGFANFICDFYNSIKESNGFIERYNKSEINSIAIKRCIGISF